MRLGDLQQMGCDMGMPRRRLSASHTPFNIWPGFVDALSALVLVMLFVFMVFVVAQFYLSGVLHSQEKSLDSLNQIIRSLQKTLGIEKARARASEKNVQALREENLRLAVCASEKDRDLAGERANRAMKDADLQALAAELEKLNAQLQALAEALGVAEARVDDKEREIKGLTDKLNAAMQKKLEEITGYRSEFFAKLKEALGKRSDVRVVGDRFIFQSEILFDVGSDKIGPEGQKQLRTLSHALKEIARKIPKKMAWILRVDGHTDRLPMHSEAFESNWELSIARALAVVKFLIAQGIPPQHVVAAGFGEFHPLDPQKSSEALARNRRIEFKLDQR